MFVELIERQDIRPSPYLGRHNWVMLDNLGAVRNDELENLIRQSYEMVAAKAPKLKVLRVARKKKHIGERVQRRARAKKH